MWRCYPWDEDIRGWSPWEFVFSFLSEDHSRGWGYRRKQSNYSLCARWDVTCSDQGSCLRNSYWKPAGEDRIDRIFISLLLFLLFFFLFFSIGPQVIPFGLDAAQCYRMWHCETRWSQLIKFPFWICRSLLIMAYIMILSAFLAHVCLLTASSLDLEGRKAHQEEYKITRDKQPIYNQPRSLDHHSMWIRTTESSILAQNLAEDLPKHVASFLYTGDSNELRRANCSKRYELTSLSGVSPTTTHQSLHSSVDLLVHSSNFLNMMLQSNKSRDHTSQRDLEWYSALIRSILEGEPRIQRSAITFNVDPLSHIPQVFLQASREEDEIHLQDLSSSAHHLANATQETDWFHSFKHKWRPHQHKRFLNGAKTLEDSWKKGSSYLTDKSHIKWSSPFLECQHGKYKPNWILSLSAAFYGLKPNLVREFR